jgi:Phosphotransferase enzyme family
MMEAAKRGNSLVQNFQSLMQEESEDSAQKSPDRSRSTTPNSTSTYTYRHESFSTYQSKIVELAGQIGATSVIDVTNLHGGSNNRVISVTVTYADEVAPPITGVFRIPRDPAWDDDQKVEVGRRMHEHVVLLSLLAVHEILAPRILAFDATYANAIDSPYTFQQCAVGIGLDEVHDKMSLEERLKLVDEFVGLLIQLESVKFAKAGRIVPADHSNEPGSARPNAVGLLDPRLLSKAVTGISIKGFGTEGKPTQHFGSLLDMLNEQFARWVTFETEGVAGPPNDVVPNMFKRLQKIMQEMQVLGFFEAFVTSQEGTKEPSNILYHPDLEPRHILVAASPEERWKISAILDWDDAISVPQILSRAPPFWLWDTSDPDPFVDDSVPRGFDGTADLLPADRYAESSGKLSEDDRSVKTYFEESFVRRLSHEKPSYDMATYQDEAYGRGRWLRRLAWFAVDGFTEGEVVHRFDHFVDDWEHAQSTLKHAARDMPTSS